MNNESEEEITGAGPSESDDAMVLKRAREASLSSEEDELDSPAFEAGHPSLSGEEAIPPENPEDLIDEADRPGNGFPPIDAGHQVPRQELEDEGNAAEAEIAEGISEADIDTRAHSRH